MAWGLTVGITVDRSIHDRRSTFNVDGGLDVYVAVKGQRSTTTSTSTSCAVGLEARIDAGTSIPATARSARYTGHAREAPCAPPPQRQLSMEEPPRFELGNGGFADHCLTTWLWLLKALAMYQTSAARSTRPRHCSVTPPAVRRVPWGRSAAVRGPAEESCSASALGRPRRLPGTPASEVPAWRSDGRRHPPRRDTLPASVT